MHIAYLQICSENSCVVVAATAKELEKCLHSQSLETLLGSSPTWPHPLCKTLVCQERDFQGTMKPMDSMLKTPALAACKNEWFNLNQFPSGMALYFKAHATFLFQVAVVPVNIISWIYANRMYIGICPNLGTLFFSGS